jgi:uncharacterized protein
VEHLLRLQTLDLKIEQCKDRELEIPKQKSKYDVQRQRLGAELAESENRFKAMQLEQRECERDIEAKQEQINKYNTQLMAVKKNEEYQALLHEIEGVKKQIAQREERIIQLMVEMDEAQVKVAEDKARISAELKHIDAECATIDAELAEAVESRKTLEGKRKPLVDACEPKILRQYERIRHNKKQGAAIVPLLSGTVCGGCHMQVQPQMVNEVMAGEIRQCRSCGRILYYAENFDLKDIRASV